MGLYALANAGMTPFGSLLVGTIAEHLGVRAACMLGGGGGLLAVAALVLIGRRAGIAWTLPREARAPRGAESVSPGCRR